MKTKGMPGTVKIGDIELATVESLEMKTPGFKLGPYEWDGSFCGEFTRPEPETISMIHKSGWRHLWRRYYSKCNMNNINIDIVDAETVTASVNYEVIGEVKTDNIFGRIWATIRRDKNHAM